MDEEEESKSKASGYMLLELVGSPLRVEYHIGMADGSRVVDKSAVAAVNPALTAALTNMAKRKVKVMPEQDTLKGDGQKSAISEPMDEHIDFDSFWEKLIDMIKSPPNAPIAPQIVEVSKEEFDSVVVVPDTKTKLTTKVKHNKAAGEMMAETLQDGEVVGSSTVILHREPLRVESWGVDSEGKRLSGHGTARGLQEYVDTALAKERKRRKRSRCH